MSGAGIPRRDREEGGRPDGVAVADPQHREHGPRPDGRTAFPPGPRVSFTVHGVAQPAGSKVAFYNRKSGRAVIADDNRRAKPWQALVSAAALEAMAGRPVLAGPLALTLAITLPRPKGHYGRGGHADTIRPGAPSHPTVKPDATKLLRAIEDACTGIVWRDDAQIVDQHVRKFYGEPSRCELAVWQLDGAEVPA